MRLWGSPSTCPPARFPVWLAALVLLLATLAVQPARAALAKAEIDAVTSSPKAGAAIPLDLTLMDPQGQPLSLGDLLGGRPSLLMLADYRCTQLCGSILAIAAAALHDSGLRPGLDINLLVVDFNPEATALDGAALRQDQIGAYPDLKASAHFLTGSPGAVDRLEAALGFTAVRDAAEGRYAHPTDLFVLTPDGRVSRLLNGLSIDHDSVRLALVEAGQGRIGSLVDRLHVLCYGLDPLSGASNGLAQTMLRGGAGLTLAGAAALLLFGASRRGRKPGKGT